MTKVTVIGEGDVVDKRPIKFSFVATTQGGMPVFMDAGRTPNAYKFVELVSRNYTNGLDLMFAHDGDRTKGCAYLGHFNDGIV